MTFDRTSDAAASWRSFVRLNTLQVKKRGSDKLAVSVVRTDLESSDVWCDYLTRLGCPVDVQRAFLDPLVPGVRSVKTPWDVLSLIQCEVTPDDVQYFSKCGIRDLATMRWHLLNGLIGRTTAYYRRNGITSMSTMLAIHTELYPEISRNLASTGLHDREVISAVVSLWDLGAGLFDTDGVDVSMFCQALATFVSDRAGTPYVSYGRRGNIEIDADELAESITAAMFVSAS